MRVPYGVTLFDAASWNGIAIDSTCGGHGTCKKCRIRIAEDPPAPSSLDIRAYTAQEIKDGWRLACRTTAIRDTQVEVPPLTTRPKAATVGVGRQVILRPAVQKRYLELAEPSLADQASDLERVLAQLDDLEPRAELSVLKTLGRTLREADYKVTAVVVDDVLIAVEPGDTTARRFGIAFDLGTTTVVATLLDLSTGTPAGVESTLNKQQPFGADVITRISATMMDPGALDKLQNLARETMAELAQAVCAQGGVAPHEVYEVAVAGNATMTHLVLGIDPEPLGMAPFIMATRLYPEVLAADLGLGGIVHPRARAVVFPAFGAYVGGDITAGLLASGMDRDARVRLFVDIGTNCEIVLGNRDWLLATAAPAGPAFEGAAIRCGMRAADGAIEVVTMTPDELTLKVIGDAEPQGLCGSGLVDAVTGLVKVGLLDSSGRFIAEEAARDTAPGLAGRLTMIGKERVFVLHWRGPKDPAESIYLSQRDVRELQFAKAAIATGWQILLEEAGLEAADVKQVLLAGSFGSYLSPASAIRIGLVPKVPVMRVVSAGNVAGEGAKMALLSLRERAGGLALLEEVRYVELSDRADFNDRFVEQLRRFPWQRLRSWPAGRWPGTCARSWPAAAGRPPSPRCPPCCTTGRRRSSQPPNGPWPPPSHRAGPSPWPTPTAAATARWTSSAPGTACAACPGCTATTCSAARTGSRRCSTPSPAPTCSPTSCCAASTGPCWPGSAWTGTRSCGTTTSGTTPGWSGWPRSRRRRWRPRRTG